MVTDRSPRAATGPTYWQRTLAVVALLLSVTLAWQGAQLFRQDLAFTAIETEVSFWGRGTYEPEEATREWVGRSLLELLDSEPGHPGYLMLAASYYEWRAYWAQEVELEYDYTRRAERAREMARHSRPVHPSSRITKAE